jgi:ATP-grasp domain, R2K clade family 3
VIAVLSESEFRDTSSINGRELERLTQTAQMLGCRIVPLPDDLNAYSGVDQIFDYVPDYAPAIPGVWIGYIPSPERYAQVYEVASRKGILLLNTPAQYRRAMEFDQFYPIIHDLTPRSLIVSDLADVSGAAQDIGYPVFVKGAIKSNKEQGWDACVAQDEAHLHRIAQDLFDRPGRSRGHVILRELVKLQKMRTTYDQFPLGREYRVFLYDHQPIAHGFYWEEQTDEAILSALEQRRMLELAVETSRRLEVPFLSVDVGQLETGEWIIIEVGDAQFSGLSQVPPLQLWNQLVQALERDDGTA